MEARAVTEGPTNEHPVPGSDRPVEDGGWRRPLRVLGDLVTCRVTAAQTGGAYSLFEAEVRPQGGPPPHIQHGEDECFFVLEGKFAFSGDGWEIQTGPRGLVYVPKGALHAYRNVGTTTGRLLVSQTPGGTHERFFQEVGEPAYGAASPPLADRTPELKEFADVAAKYGIEVLLPPS